MPQRKSGIKELRKTQKRHLRNLDAKTAIRKSTKAFLKAVESKNASEIKSSLTVLQKKIDKAAKENLIHKNTASRRISRYSKLAKSAAK